MRIKKQPIAHMRPHYPHMRKLRGNSTRKFIHTIYSIQTQLQDVLRIERPATLVL